MIYNLQERFLCKISFKSCSRLWVIHWRLVHLGAVSHVELFPGIDRAPLALVMVAGLLYLFRKIYTEVVSALPVNGGYVYGGSLSLSPNEPPRLFG